MARVRKAADDRRAEIQRVALGLFTRHGYETTSLREIAEELGITKAGVYYHFDSKEAIVRSLFEERLAALDGLVEWAEGQPRTPERSAAIAAGWFRLLVADGLEFARFAIANQAALRDLAPHRGNGALDRVQKISALLADAGAPPSEQLRIRMAMISVNLAVMAAHGLDLTDEEILAAASEVAGLIAPSLATSLRGSAAEGGEDLPDGGVPVEVAQPDRR
ncbi:TetR/AcrR family transcriptional regulator [Actinokineospora sp. NBRC 105648]|uniref:TetR/AcrR family transcriptional regulator n=1 Tax=Actinokineospora sp. NBRC 105648 TaxID=3032206 RepID=UPI0024A0B9CE|nr:TetR/AcrR family transcriptional regulator [Actinokineospora sp. NBRC 105648]GLZ41071.1 TetR family transcriptional regulator [Actinokineospora sp. NBRC 105648]